MTTTRSRESCWHVERQLRAALIERAEQQRGQHDAERVIAAHQRDGNADEAEAAGEVEGQAVLIAHDDVERDQAGERAREAHRDDDLAGGRDAAVDRSALVLADDAERVAPAGLPDEQPDQNAADQGDDEGEIERRFGDVDADCAERLLHLRQPGVFSEGGGFRSLLPGPDQDVDQQVGHQRRGEEIEHDRGDHDVAAAPRLQPARDERPEAAEQRRRQDRERQDQRERQPAEVEADQRDAEAADVGLPLAADVEQAAVEGDRDRETREDEAGRVKQGVADRLAVAERAVDQELDRLERVLAEQQHEQARDEERRRQIEQWQEAKIDPGRQLPRARRHQRSASVSRPCLTLLPRAHMIGGVDFPDFPGCITAGSTLGETRRMAAEALEFHIEGMLEENLPIPEPSSLEAVMADPENGEAIAFPVALPDRLAGVGQIEVTLAAADLEELDSLAKKRATTRQALLVEAVRRLLAAKREDHAA